MVNLLIAFKVDDKDYKEWAMIYIYIIYIIVQCTTIVPLNGDIMAK